MSVRKSNATWTGNLKRGSGTMEVGRGNYKGPYTFASRFENVLDGAGFTPNSVKTTAEVTLGEDDEGPAITGIKLVTEADVPEIDKETFQQHAEAAKDGCPVSKALAGTTITLDATLV